MTEQWWVMLRPDGVVGEQIISDRRPGKGWHKVDRVGDLARETWKPWRGWVAREAEAIHKAIDEGHAIDHGAHAIAVARAVKEIEARLIMSGVPIPGGRIEQEAAATGRDIGDLAAEVIRQADGSTVAIELDRVGRKDKVRRNAKR